MPNTKQTFASKISQKIQNRFGISYKASLLLAMGLNLTMGIGWTIASILGGSSFLIAEASDSFGDAISYGLSVFASKESNKVKTVVTFIKAGITFALSSIALIFSITRFALTWAVNPVLGIALSGAGIGINSLCAYLLGKEDKKENLDSIEKGEEKLKKANWIHTISDLSAGFVGMFFSILDLVGVPGADLTGGVIGATIGFYSAKDIFKEANELRKLTKEEGINNGTQITNDIEIQCNLCDLKSQEMERNLTQEKSIPLKIFLSNEAKVQITRL